MGKNKFVTQENQKQKCNKISPNYKRATEIKEGNLRVLNLRKEKETSRGVNIAFLLSLKMPTESVRWEEIDL